MKEWEQALAEALATHVGRCGLLTSPVLTPRLHLLTTLDLKGCGLTTLPDAIGLCTGLEKLDLGGNDLTTLPDSMRRLQRLEVLFIQGSRRLKEVPQLLGDLPQLTRLGLRGNGIEAIADDALPPNVQHLILTDNKLTNIDGIFPRLTHVRKLMLSNNHITSLSAAGVRLMQELELIRLANNRLASIPRELLTLPNLAWVAVNGNPLSHPAPSAVIDVDVSSDDLVIDESRVLGKGASGLVLAGEYKGQPVAIKNYEASGISSDGRATDELAIYSAVSHPALVHATAIVHRPHPKVVMEILSSDMHELAGPPTIKEMTRDVYKEGQTFSSTFVLSVLRTLVRLRDRPSFIFSFVDRAPIRRSLCRFESLYRLTFV
jgi:hypothetical protein